MALSPLTHDGGRSHPESRTRSCAVALIACIALLLTSLAALAVVVMRQKQHAREYGQAARGPAEASVDRPPAIATVNREPLSKSSRMADVFLKTPDTPSGLNPIFLINGILFEPHWEPWGHNDKGASVRVRIGQEQLDVHIEVHAVQRTQAVVIPLLEGRSPQAPRWCSLYIAPSSSQGFSLFVNSD